MLTYKKYNLQSILNVHDQFNDFIVSGSGKLRKKQTNSFTEKYLYDTILSFGF